MQIFESTEMERLEDHTAYTHAGSVTADHIIVADKLSNTISPLADEAFHAQTFLSVTEPSTRNCASCFRTATRCSAGIPNWCTPISD
jgi:hypothetical protein